MPCILGYDIAGVVDATGPGVTEFSPGDRVMAMTHFPDGAGGYSELAVVDAGLAAPIGEAASMTEAAAAPLAAGTAWTVLARLRPGDGQRIREIAALLAAGVLHPVISHQLPLDQAARAHHLLESHHPGGKIVLTVTR